MLLNVIGNEFAIYFSVLVFWTLLVFLVGFKLFAHFNPLFCFKFFINSKF